MVENMIKQVVGEAQQVRVIKAGVRGRRKVVHALLTAVLGGGSSNWERRVRGKSVINRVR